MRHTLSLLVVLSSILCAQAWQSSKVYYGTDGRLQYPRDANNNRMPDYSFAGYKKGESAIPSVPTVMTISPISGDNTTHIQNAINTVGVMTLTNGIRGALLLTAGMYRVSGTLRINFDGVVLRGVGSGADSLTNTIIYATGNSPAQRSVIVAGGGSNNKWSGQVSGTKTNITSDTVLAGDSVITVASASSLNVGDNIILYHPSTAAWLAAIDYGGTHSNDPGAEPGVDVPWDVGGADIIFNRYIKAKSGNTLTLDVPVYSHFIKSLSQAYVYKYNRSGLKTNIGIENLRVDIEYASAFDEAHAWQAIDMFQLEDAWLKNCTMIHFGQAGVRTATATRVTVENCQALDPVSLIDGERRYNFCLYLASQMILFKNCIAKNGRHHYISNGASSTSGNVFLNCTSSGAYAPSEGHRLWTQGILFDNHTELDGPRAGYTDILLALYNRGYYGTSHGWAIVHSTAWKCDVLSGDLIIQKPPTAQNYAIGCKGAHVSGLPPYAPFDEPEGFIEGSNTSGLIPSSLYTAQLNDRLGNYSEPTTQASNAAAIVSGSGQVKLSCTAGSGTFRIIVARVDSAVNSAPSDFVTYSANPVFGSGSAIGSGNYVVYKGVYDTVTVTGLAALSNYYFAVYEFNGAAGAENYLTANPARCSVRTSSTLIYSNGTGGGIWDSSSAWLGGVVPDSGSHVILNSGDTVKITRSGVRVFNITVPAGTVLTANGSFVASANVKYVIINGNDVVNNGVFGTGTDGLSIRVADSCRLSGSAEIKIARLAPYHAAAKVTIDNNTRLTYRAGATSSGAALIFVDGGTIPVPAYMFQSITLAAGKTLTFANYSKLQQSSTQDQDWNINTVFTVNGSIVMGDSSTLIVLRSASGNTISFIVNGNVTCRSFIPSSFSGNNPANISINQGGTFIVGQGISASCDFSNPNASVGGGGTFQLLSGATMSITSPYGLDTINGHVRTASRIFSSGVNYTFSGTQRQRTGNGFPQTVNNLSVNTADGVMLTKSIEVNGTLTLTGGRIYLQNSTLTLGQSSVISGTPSSSKMIVTDGTGSIKKKFAGTGSFTFPLGDTVAANYTPVTVSFSSGAFSSASVEVKVNPVRHPKDFSPANYLRRYWSVSQTGITNFVSTVTANYSEGDIVGNESALFPALWDTAWRRTGNLNTSANQVQFTGLTSFGDITASDSLTAGGGGTIILKCIPQGYMNMPTQTLNIRDTFSVYLASNTFPFANVDTCRAVLDSITASMIARFGVSPNGSRYLVLKGRNHLETWSREGGFTFYKGGLFEFDFSADSSAVFAANQRKAGSQWEVFGGDVNSDGIIDFSDLIQVDNDNIQFASGYLITDIDGNGFVDFSDLSIVDNNSLNFISVKSPISSKNNLPSSYNNRSQSK